MQYENYLRKIYYREKNNLDLVFKKVYLEKVVSSYIRVNTVYTAFINNKMLIVKYYYNKSLNIIYFKL